MKVFRINTISNELNWWNNCLHLLRKLAIFCTFTFVISSSLFSQSEKPDFISADRDTYRFYLSQNWDSLIITGREALKNNIDYFYLRMRLGIAYFEKENYAQASQHFEKALKYSTIDQATLEYLYYSYLYTNRELEARLLSHQFNESLYKKINPSKSKVIDEIYLETGPTFSNNISLNSMDNLMGRDSLFGEQDLNDNKYYFQLGFKKNIGKRTSMYLGYSNLSVSKLKQIQTSELGISGYESIPYNGGSYINTLYSKTYDNYNHDYTLYQNDLYLNANIALGNGFTFVPATHIIFAKYNQMRVSVKPVEYFVQSYDTIPSVKYEFTNHYSDTSFVNYVGWMSLYKNISNYRIGLLSSYSNLNGKSQFQIGGELVWFPKGNLNLYSVSRIVLALEDDKKRPVIYEKVGSRIGKNLWLEGMFAFGTMINYTESNAFVVHNSGDKINLSAGANLILSLSSKIELSFRYQFLNRSTYIIRLQDNGIISNTTINYQNNKLIAGIKWKL